MIKSFPAVKTTWGISPGQSTPPARPHHVWQAKRTPGVIWHVLLGSLSYWAINTDQWRDRSNRSHPLPFFQPNGDCVLTTDPHFQWLEKWKMT